MTELQAAFDSYACNQRPNLSNLLRSSISEITQTGGEIAIGISRWDALHPATHIRVRSVAPNRWIMRGEHKYRQQPGSHMPPFNYDFTNEGELYDKLRGVITENVCTIHVLSSRGKYQYHTSDLNLFR